MVDITQESLKQLLHYNPDTGEFTWLERDRKWFSRDKDWKRFNTLFAGEPAGAIQRFRSGKLYVSIKLFRRSYLAHRLAHLIMLGVFPDEVDHDDGNGLNNKWSNIERGVTADENAKNHRKRVDNASGVTGVSWCKNSQNWRAYINAKGRWVHIGVFSSFEAAVAARKAKELEFAYHWRHGEARPL